MLKFTIFYSCNLNHFLFIVPVSQYYYNHYTDIDNLNPEI